jgi:thiol-disulfide isomerase/thioredoxin
MERSIRRSWAGVLLLALLAACHLDAWAGTPAGMPLPIGTALPEVMMHGLNGPDRDLRTYVGRRLIINVWASWCGPCRSEAASLERFAWTRRGMQYAVIGISTDDDRGAAQNWLRRSNATLSHFIDRNLEMEHLLGASSIPLTVLVDERGRIVQRVYGAHEWDSAESGVWIDQAFKNVRPHR